jgi:hypothetical protein
MSSHSKKLENSLQNMELSMDNKLASIQREVEQQSTRRITPDSASTPLIGLSSSPEDRPIILEEQTISDTIEHFCSEEKLENLLSEFEPTLEIR